MERWCEGRGRGRVAVRGGGRVRASAGWQGSGGGQAAVLSASLGEQLRHLEFSGLRRHCEGGTQ